jgi:hypothetical protein
VICRLTISLLLFITATSCIKKNDLPIVPKIAYKSFENFQDDSAYFTLKFDDGDGDLGLNPEDTTGNFSGNSPYYYNLYLKYLYKKPDGTWSAFFNPNPMINDTQYYKFRVPLIEIEGKDKSMSGEIRVKLSELRPSMSHKYLKYVFYVYDRALHQSNVETSPEFYIP